MTYYSQIIKPNETRVFNFIFEVPNEFYYDTFTLKCLYNISYVKDELKYKYKKVRLSPETFNEKTDTVSTKKLGEKLSFKGSLLGNTTIKINDISINDSFNYKVIKCNTSGCINRIKSVSAPISENFDFKIAW